MWNERIQLGPLTTAAAPQMLLEVFAEKMGKGERAWLASVERPERPVSND